MSPPEHPWSQEQVADYIRKLFERDFMRAADRYGHTEIPRLQLDAAKRGVGIPSAEALLARERQAAANASVDTQNRPLMDT